MEIERSRLVQSWPREMGGPNEVYLICVKSRTMYSTIGISSRNETINTSSSMFQQFFSSLSFQSLLPSLFSISQQPIS